MYYMMSYILCIKYCEWFYVMNCSDASEFEEQSGLCRPLPPSDVQWLLGHLNPLYPSNILQR